MTDRTTLHILDSESVRRAQLARLAFAAGHHAEIYATIEEFVAHAPERGLLLVQDDCSGPSIAELIDTLLQAGQWMPVIALAERPRTPDVVLAIKAGAFDYLEVPQQIGPLNEAIERALQESEGHRNRRSRAVEARQRIACLSPREREVLDRLAEGLSNKAIARDLAISPRTVEIHRMKMMAKLGARHAADAVRLRIEADPLIELAA